MYSCSYLWKASIANCGDSIMANMDDAIVLIVKERLELGRKALKALVEIKIALELDAYKKLHELYLPSIRALLDEAESTPGFKDIFKENLCINQTKKSLKN